MGIKGAPRKIDIEQLRKFWRFGSSRADLARIGVEVPEQLAALFVMDGDEIDRITNEAEPLTDVPRRAGSAESCAFGWNVPEILARLKSDQNVSSDLKKNVVLLFSRTSAGKIYVVEIEEQAEKVWRQTDGLRNVGQIASALSLPLKTVQDTLQELNQIGAVVLPPQ